MARAVTPLPMSPAEEFLCRLLAGKVVYDYGAGSFGSAPLKRPRMRHLVAIEKSPDAMFLRTSVFGNSPITVVKTWFSRAHTVLGENRPDVAYVGWPSVDPMVEPAEWAAFIALCDRAPVLIWQGTEEQASAEWRAYVSRRILLGSANDPIRPVRAYGAKHDHQSTDVRP